jgi:predicted metal-dependent peptidase
MDQSVNRTPAQTILNTSTPMGNAEISELAFLLQSHHAIFYKFFSVGRPIFEMSLPTAAVYASRETGQFLYLKINPLFWRGLSMPERTFIIAHECIHLILDHLVRLSHPGINSTIANYAADLVVNHMCVEKFGFKRSQIDPEGVYCWIDKFFTPEENVFSGETMEYYYNLLEKKHEAGKLPMSGEGAPRLVDQHEQIDEEAVKDFIEKMDKLLSPQEKEALSKLAGIGGEGIWTFLNVRVKKKKKWETVIKQWAVKTVGFKQKNLDQWARSSRRMAFLKQTGLFLPAEMELDERKQEKKKIVVHFYLDTSGSCHHLAERFFTAAKSLPTEHFDIRLFCFHDYVVETDITGDKVHKGGGTAFHIIEENIQLLMGKEGTSYPKAVFVITDGMGTPVAPQIPESWHWFLSEDYKNYIPKKSMAYKLTDYE